MNATGLMAGGPLGGQAVELHPVQDRDGMYGVLAGRDVSNPGDPAYVRDCCGRWVWQGKPWPTD